MSSASSMFEVGAVVLGYFGVVATWRRLSPNMGGHFRDYTAVTIQTCSDSDENSGYTPAQSVTVNGRVALLALRAAIDEALKEGGEA